MTPAPGERLVRYVGDILTFRLSGVPGARKAFLRTTLGSAAVLRDRVGVDFLDRVEPDMHLGGAEHSFPWRDIPMRAEGDAWVVAVALAEVGWFRAKAYLIDEEGFEQWPPGNDFGVSVHPDALRTGNTIYCAFTRMFGPTRTIANSSPTPEQEAHIAALDAAGYSVIPPSGTFRQLKAQLPHILDTLGCRILHLLPVNPTPTTFARFGRFGSPYAVQDLMAIDPALVEFDKRTTGIEQFVELAEAVHAKGALLILDIVINHTGWGSQEYEKHPEWFLKDGGGQFISPGAWGTVWEDLVEIDHHKPDSWNYLCEVFLTWCRRGVDGFRCDAGYKVPVETWRLITAKVRDYFPNAVFLLEGLGGSWEATENLLTEGGMQWAYSELFQNYDAQAISGYLDYALSVSRSAGTMVHYSETHDNPRLAGKGAAWSLHRNQLCALTSVSGGFGFTCGVEWLAPERVNVHSSRGLNWGSEPNLVRELARLNHLLSKHPCFFDGATLTRLSEPGAPVYALARTSAEGLDHMLVLINPDAAHQQWLDISLARYEELGSPGRDLLADGAGVFCDVVMGDRARFVLQPGQCLCLVETLEPRGLAGDEYRKIRAQAAAALQAVASVLKVEQIGRYEWRELAALFAADPAAFAAALTRIDPVLASQDLIAALKSALGSSDTYQQAVTLTAADANRATPVPAGHWVVVRHPQPFRLSTIRCGSLVREAEGPEFTCTTVAAGDVVLIKPNSSAQPLDLRALVLQPLSSPETTIRLEVFGCGDPLAYALPRALRNQDPARVLLTNGLGGMARIHADISRISSKYDCLLAANMSPTVPTDRHVFVKRMRLWANANGFLTQIVTHSVRCENAGHVARWTCEIPAGPDRFDRVTFLVEIEMPQGKNGLVIRFLNRSNKECRFPVRFTVRLDIEDRNFHNQTTRNGAADWHFTQNTRQLQEGVGFEFTPAPDRILRVNADKGVYHPSPEWSEHIPHSVEASRGQVGSGDAWSPGWFDLPLDSCLTLDVPYPVITGEVPRVPEVVRLSTDASLTSQLAGRLSEASHAFIVRRGPWKSVIAGYPWFLDWGRDSLICARGLIAGGMIEEVRQLLITFGRFEQDGTLPNTIHGDDASNRDTSDAPLWYGVVAEDFATLEPGIYGQLIPGTSRTIADVLLGIARGYRDGTPNGIRMDAASGLIWSPSHFTWMDTNYPAGTPREGYPIEIQALWLKLLRQLARLGLASGGVESWSALADRAEASLKELYWIESNGWYSDCLNAGSGIPARDAVQDDALRNNCLFPIAFGQLDGERARRCVQAARDHLIVPGALRSLAPLPTKVPLPIYSSHGGLLNDLNNPYWPRYEGDEDSRRKPAYHNGTAWTWTFPTFCEALAVAWGRSPEATAAAASYLHSMLPWLEIGCLGQIPEVIDGDFPHYARGCDAQAWGATEGLRVARWLEGFEAPSQG